MKKISDIQTGGLHYIFGKLKALKALEEKITPYLPKELQKRCRLANSENGILKFAVANSAWGTRLHYFSAELLEKLHKNPDLQRIMAIHYYIEPDFNTLFKH